MELLVLLILLFAVFLYVMIRGAIEEKNKKIKYRKYLTDLYGSFMDKVYTPKELDRISTYYLQKQGTNDIDDITWNDLSMDKVFAHINFTQSSSGEEYLYAMLRQPLLNDNNNKHKCMEKHIKYMKENEDKRLDTMLLLYELGNTGKYSLFEYLNYISELGIRSNLTHYVCMALLILAIVLIFIKTSLGVPVFIAVVCINLATYIKEKGIAAPYVTTFSYIMRMIICSDGILKLGYGDDMSDYVSELSKIRKKFKSFEQNSGMVLKMSASTGDMLEIIFDYIKMMTHIDIIKFNKMLNIVQKNKAEISQMVEYIGYIDTVISICYFRAALPYYCKPRLYESKNSSFAITDGYHPCIENPVSNSFNQTKGMIITGSNASGKSTFLKTTAINAILAQTIHTCAAKEYTSDYFRIYSSMALRDNLDNGESYYIVEIKALKRIMDAAADSDKNPLLCFVDEVLRGTNTVERIAASAQILEKLSKKGIYCFAATHDIELTHLLEKSYNNYHFEEEVIDGDILFSYKLLEGRAHTRNAIKLLEVIGFSDDIIRKADNMAGEFLKKGKWES